MQADVAAATVDWATVRFADDVAEAFDPDLEGEPVRDDGVDAAGRRRCPNRLARSSSTSSATPPSTTARRSPSRSPRVAQRRHRPRHRAAGGRHCGDAALIIASASCSARSTSLSLDRSRRRRSPAGAVRRADPARSARRIGPTTLWARSTAADASTIATRNDPASHAWCAIASRACAPPRCSSGGPSKRCASRTPRTKTHERRHVDGGEHGHAHLDRQRDRRGEHTAEHPRQLEPGLVAGAGTAEQRFGRTALQKSVEGVAPERGRQPDEAGVTISSGTDAPRMPTAVNTAGSASDRPISCSSLNQRRKTVAARVADERADAVGGRGERRRPAPARSSGAA